MPIEAFLQRALLTSACLGPLCALLGVFVTARRMSFFSDTVAHAALAGVALGLWLGIPDPTLPMIGFSLAVALLILWLKEHTDLLNDTIMALLLSGSVAFGMVLLSLLKGYRGELDRMLFGDIYSVGWNDVRIAVVVAVAVGGILFWKLNDLALVTAHEDLAHVSGIPVARLNLLFIVLLTVTVCLSIRLLGIVLVTSLVVIPPAAARNVARSLRQQVLVSLVLGFVGAAGGVFASFRFDLPGGPSITLALVALFLLSLPFARRGRSSRTVQAGPPTAA